MPNFLSAKICQKRKMAPADQLKADDDIDMPFTMTALETIINFGQILEIKEENPAAPRGRHFTTNTDKTPTTPCASNLAQSMDHDQATTLGSLPRPNTRGTTTYYTAPVQDKPKTIANSKGNNTGHPGPGKSRSTRTPARDMGSTV